MNNNPEIQQEDEISLLDLFTVLIRYRKLIICVTVFSAVMAVAGYFFYPAYQYKKASRAEDRFLIKTSFTINPYAGSLVNQSLDSLINNAEIVYDSLRDSGMQALTYGRNQMISLADEAERTRALFLVNELLIKGVDLNGKAIPENSRRFRITALNANSVEIYFKHTDSVFVNSFIQSLFILSNERILNSIRSDADVIVQNYEQLLFASNGLQYTQQVLAENYRQYTYLKNSLEGRENVLSQGNAVVTETMIVLDTFQNAYALKGIVLVFAGFFMAVFLAFALNVIRNIKNDEEAMKKIHDALGNTGEK